MRTVTTDSQCPAHTARENIHHWLCIAWRCLLVTFVCYKSKMCNKIIVNIKEFHFWSIKWDWVKVKGHKFVNIPFPLCFFTSYMHFVSISFIFQCGCILFSHPVGGCQGMAFCLYCSTLMELVSMRCLCNDLTYPLEKREQTCQPYYKFYRCTTSFNFESQ